MNVTASKIQNTCDVLQVKQAPDGCGSYLYKGSTWVKKQAQHSHFKSCRNQTWPFIKTVESDVKVL